MKSLATRRRGFTIVEVLVVVILISVLAALIVPRYFKRVGTAKQGVAENSIAQIANAVEMFKYDHGRFPQGLDELVNRPADIAEDKWDPQLQAKHLIDPWGRPYVYRCPGDHDTYDLYSLGADGAEGGEGENADVCSWD